MTTSAPRPGPEPDDWTFALARGFDLPVTWFFLPPPPWLDGRPVKLDTPDTRERFGHTMAAMIDLVFGTREQAAVVTLRMQQFFTDLGEELLTSAQRRVDALVNDRLAGPRSSQSE